MNEVLKQFLESSTIHGLQYISSTRSILRLTWILIIVAGFSFAAILIYESFDNWNKNPITTTIETLPITEITLPKVTVCPPKGTYTNLNYDFETLKKRKHFNETTRNELLRYAIAKIQNHVHKEIMTNMSKILEEKQYYNWYNGYTLLSLPYYDKINDRLVYHVNTAATSGSVSTSHFGYMDTKKGKMRQKVEKNLKAIVDVSVPQEAKNNKTLKISFEVDKLTMSDIRFFQELE